jgi:hypothetical protein
MAWETYTKKIVIKAQSREDISNQRLELEQTVSYKYDKNGPAATGQIISCDAGDDRRCGNAFGLAITSAERNTPRISFEIDLRYASQGYNYPINECNNNDGWWRVNAHEVYTCKILAAVKRSQERVVTCGGTWLF